jgi:hyperosmotically inducible protein
MKGGHMKKIGLLEIFAWAACIVFVTAAHAQGSDSSVSASAVSASSPSAVARATGKADRKLGLDVRRALAKTKGINVAKIFVRVRGGSVVLSGTVPSGEQIRHAEQVAKGVTGVTSVTNRLSSSPESGS